jgi:hypothetical protein
MNSFFRSWELMQQSFAVLRSDKQLVLFPILSGISAILVAAVYWVPMILMGVGPAKGEPVNPAFYAWIFLWLATNYFVIVFFNCALAACAQVRFSGGTPSIAVGVSAASAKLPRILLWALVSATVGTVLRFVEDRSSLFGRIVSGLIGAAWAMATYLIVPVLVFENQDVFASVKRSAELLKQTWGARLGSGFGFALPFLVLSLPGALCVVLAVLVHPAFFAVAVLYFLVVTAVMSALKGIFAVALYRYATEGQAPAGFSGTVLNGAFVDLGAMRAC